MAAANPKQAPSETRAYTVLRAICIASERVEVGAELQLTNAQGTELASAGKVVLSESLPPKAAKPVKAAKPADAEKE